MNRQISTELARLWVHARSEYEDIRLMEQKLEKARRRHVELHEEIHKLIESAAGTPSGADADLQVARGPAGSFSLIPFTPKGAAGVAHIERVLGTLEVVDDNTCVHALKYCEQSKVSLRHSRVLRPNCATSSRRS